MTKDLTVVLALKALVHAALPGASLIGFDKDADKPARIGPHGCIIGHAGDPGEPEVDLSPLTYNYEHEIIVEIAAGNGAGGGALDDMLLTLGDAIAADPYLGGECQFLSVQEADLGDRSAPALASTNWATVSIIAEYSTTNPLG